jgi:hypothetical protein
MKEMGSDFTAFMCSFGFLERIDLGGIYLAPHFWARSLNSGAPDFLHLD